MARIMLMAPLALFGLATLSVASASPASMRGESLFRQRCQSCHAVEAGKINALGPNLRGVVGRKAGATGFRYSPALKGANLTWDRETLDRYLAAPIRTVPGSRMLVRINDSTQRRALIDYLASQR